MIGLQIEKVLQQGDISEAAEPYFRGHDIDKKSKDRASASAKLYCRMLGQYRMPFAWAAINVVDLIAGNQSSAASSHAAIITQDLSKDKRTDSINRRDSTGSSGTPDKKGTRIDTSKRDSRSGSMSSQISRSTMEETAIRQEDIITLSQNFSAVTLTLNMFFKQVSDRGVLVMVRRGGVVEGRGWGGREECGGRGVVDGRGCGEILALVIQVLSAWKASRSFSFHPHSQEGDKLTDEDLYRFLGEMRRPAAAINRKFKIIPGHLKMDIQQPAENLPCSLTSNLFEVNVTMLAQCHWYH